VRVLVNPCVCSVRHLPNEIYLIWHVGSSDVRRSKLQVKVRIRLGRISESEVGKNATASLENSKHESETVNK